MATEINVFSMGVSLTWSSSQIQSVGPGLCKVSVTRVFGCPALVSSGWWFVLNSGTSFSSGAQQNITCFSRRQRFSCLYLFPSVISSHTPLEFSSHLMDQSSGGRRQTAKDARNPIILQTQRRNNRTKNESCLRCQHCAAVLKRSGLQHQSILSHKSPWMD